VFLQLQLADFYARKLTSKISPDVDSWRTMSLVAAASLLGDGLPTKKVTN